MFLRSSVSALGRCVKKCPGPIRPRLPRTIHTNNLGGALCCEKKESNVDWSKSVNVTFKKHDGTTLQEVAYINETVYGVINRVDSDNNVYIGYGVCKGNASCSTCHVILDEKGFNMFAPILEAEQDMIDELPESSSFSRLGCMIYITEEMDGIVINLPKFKEVTQP